MSKFTFSDGGEICAYADGAVKRYKSAFIENYEQNLQNIARSKQWKQSGTGAIFRGDEVQDTAQENVASNISGVFPAKDEGKVVYVFTVNQTSGIYKKTLTEEVEPETHVINSHELQFRGGCLNTENDTLVTSVQRNFCNADSGIFNLESGDYRTVTDGDTLDEDPFICPDDDNIIYYSSRGVGRKQRRVCMLFARRYL